ncbi:HAD family hydrolase [Olsenella sp. Marseille-P4559]|uniref:HAD family hydrolase n=1 Tax=Olsenella sp. Marseille-P4559 TaxID=2364795 RepID=UPI0013EF355E|nr:HAD family hydrolase [Olsenella sp. Marseille-P4559]
MLHMKFDALFTDIDGTILKGDHSMSPAVRDALNACAADGMTVVLASSRSPQGIEPIVCENDLVRGCIAAFGGALLLDEQGEVLAEHGFGREVACEAADFVKDSFGSAVTCCVFTARHWFVDSREDPRIVREEGIVKTCSEEGGARAVGQNEAVDKLLFICDPAVTPAVRDALSQRLPSMHVSTSSDILVELNAGGITKAMSIHDLCELRGIDPSRTIAFGDAANDVPMLEAAGLGVAMGNGTAEAWACAGLVCETNEEDGVARTIGRLRAGEL